MPQVGTSKEIEGLPAMVDLVKSHKIDSTRR